MIQARLFRNVQLICVLAAFGLPVAAAAQTAAPRGPSQTQPRLTPFSEQPTTHKPRAGQEDDRVGRRTAPRRGARRAAAAAHAREGSPGAAVQARRHGALVPDLRAEAAIIYNPETGQVLWEPNSQNQRSIASITKVMTAVVFLESSPDLTEEVVVERADVRAASTTYLRAGYKVTKGDLLHLTADRVRQRRRARAGARARRTASTGFIDADEREGRGARARRTRTTRIRRGCSSANVSSAYDMARLITFVGQRRAHRQRHAEAESHASTVGRRTINIHSTNQLVMKGDVDVRAARPDSSARPATAWRRCCACRRADRRWRSSCSARSRTPAASGKPGTCSTGSRRKAQDLLRRRRRLPTAAANGSLPDSNSALNSEYPRCIAAASSGSVATLSTIGMTGRVARRPSYAFRYRWQTSHA